MKKILLRLILAFLKALFTLVLACIGVFLFEALSGLLRGQSCVVRAVLHHALFFLQGGKMNPLEKEAFEHGYKIAVKMAEGMANNAKKCGLNGQADFMMAFVVNAARDMDKFVGFAEKYGMPSTLLSVEVAAERRKQ